METRDKVMDYEDYDCKICYFYERCLKPGKKCDKWLHNEYPTGWRRIDCETVTS